MTDTQTVLRNARELLSDEARWCQGSNARDSNGRRVGFDDDNACSWCLTAALRKQGSLHEASVVLYSVVRSNFGVSTYDEFNDHPDTTHADVMAVLDEAIARAEGGA